MPNTEGVKSSILELAKRFLRLIGKYGSTSLIATTFDFTVFGFVNPYLGAVKATIIGRCTGAFIAFTLHRLWVFKTYKQSNQPISIFRYVMGIIMGLCLNVSGVWLLNHQLDINPWVSRVSTAVSVWVLGFLYNKNVVFKEKIISDQDFTDIDTEDTEGSDV
jgi:putative flippase GtrA